MSTTTMTRPTAPVTASGNEPEPRHDRAGTPTTPARPHASFGFAAAAGNDACPLCGYWRCRCGGFAPAFAVTAAASTDSDPDMDEALRRARTGR